MDFEFKRGDVIIEIGKYKKYAVTHVWLGSGFIDAIAIDTGCAVTGFKDDVQRRYVKVGRWDFKTKKEVD